MTTHSVRTYVTGIYEKLNVKEGEMRKFQTGGPDGDLGSNEILRSHEIMVGLVDGSASIHDPHGVNREELARLAHTRKPLREFDKTKLSAEGFVVCTDERNVKLPDGTQVEDGARFRDGFHFLPYSDADVFVPCGGRPNSVTLENVGKFVKLKDVSGEDMLAGRYDHLDQNLLKFKIIVEGANLFLSQDARLALERCGVVLIKDASANKGGVTSSSLEVFAGLALSDDEHRRYMSATNEHDAPEFYKRYVQETLDRVAENARNEFEAI
uniref:Glutamate dehydrogenase 2 n=1 Tax=Lygus hesperus TaxID=30085 RepID=A0A0A9VVC5_LYGHE